MKHLYESDKISILERVDSISKTINNRLLPTFDLLEDEAKAVGKKKLEKLSANFHPDFMDEALVYEQAFDEEIYHYHLNSEMRKEFINSSITWLFHLFEKDRGNIFQTSDGNNKKFELEKLSINAEEGSLWDICNTELRLIANVIKHGKGESFDTLKLRKPKAIKSFNGFLSDGEIEITCEELNQYISNMKEFWQEFFKKALRFE